MAENLFSELRPFVLSNVHFTGTRIGYGAYGSVEEVTIPVGAAAKRIHGIFQDSSEIPDDEIHAVSTKFLRECQLLSILHHPNIVQFLGVCFNEGSQLPALVMERLLISLHDLLDPVETQPAPGGRSPLSFFNLHLKCCVLHNVASGLDYLHQQTPPIIHRDLSARNILLNSRLVAKIADLGVARIVPCIRSAATMTKAPGASPYMPPEAIAPANSNDQKSKYDTSIDIFSLGVVTIFTIGETFPCDPLAHNYLDESGLLVARTELQRREQYMRSVNTQLRTCGQYREDHPLIQLIQDCLHNGPHKRPNIHEVLHLLEEARAGITEEESDRNKEELIHALQIQPRNQNPEHILHDMVIRNTEITQHLRTELTRAEETIRTNQQEIWDMRETIQREQRQIQEMGETIRREQQQIWEMRQQVMEKDVLVQAKDRELAQAQQQLKEQVTEKNELVQAKNRELFKAQQQLQSSEALVAELQEALQQRDSERETLRSRTQETEPSPTQPSELSSSSACQPQQHHEKCTAYTCQVNGPGLQSATANHPTHFLVELSDPSGQPILFQQKIAAELISEVTTSSSSVGRQPGNIAVTATCTSPSQYKMSYTAVTRGQHKLHVQVNNTAINGSPFTMTVYPDPTQIGRLVKIVTGLIKPYSIAFNSHWEMIISECGTHKISTYNMRGGCVRTFGSYGDSPEQMKYPAGVAIDDEDNIYVSSLNKLQKFTSSGKLIQCVGQWGSKEGEFDDPRALTLYENKVFVCDFKNCRIQVFGRDLNFIRSIGSRGKQGGKFDGPFDIKFDNAGNMYVTDLHNARVQVLDINGHFLQAFGQEGGGKLREPSAIHIINRYVYVSDVCTHGDCIVVYETSGQFVTSFGRRGHEEGELYTPRCITSSTVGFIYVCDYKNGTVQLFCN